MGVINGSSLLASLVNRECGIPDVSGCGTPEDSSTEGSGKIILKDAVMDVTNHTLPWEECPSVANEKWSW
jgi:hypothetical protein